MEEIDVGPLSWTDYYQISFKLAGSLNHNRVLFKRPALADIDSHVFLNALGHFPGNMASNSVEALTSV